MMIAVAIPYSHSNTCLLNPGARQAAASRDRLHGHGNASARYPYPRPRHLLQSHFVYRHLAHFHFGNGVHCPRGDTNWRRHACLMPARQERDSIHETTRTGQIATLRPETAFCDEEKKIVVFVLPYQES